MPSYKLHYFNSRGRGEVARLIFAAAGQEYEDNRMTREEWLEFKPKAPFGQMPLLEVDGLFIAQSNSINRFLAKRFGLAGKTDLEAARADMIVDAMVDLIAPLIRIHYSKNETEKEEMRKKYTEETLPESVAYLEKLLISNNGGDGYFVGDELTWADIVFIDQIAWVSFGDGPDVPWDKAPKLKALKDRVEGLPKIAEWLQKRPKTEM